MDICIPIKEKSFANLFAKLKKAHNQGEIVEVWFDQLPVSEVNESNLKKIKTFYKKPIIYKYEGRKETLDKLLKTHFTYIDCDLKTPETILSSIKNKSPKTKIILSFHDFKKTPTLNVLKRLFKQMNQKKVDIIKIATYACTLNDSLRILSFLSEVSKTKSCIFLCMGKAGLLTRVTGHLLGNYLMYAPLSEKDATASGQISASKLKKLINLN